MQNSIWTNLSPVLSDSLLKLVQAATETTVVPRPLPAGQQDLTNIIHSEYQLVREGDDTLAIPDRIINKIQDSLAGIDSAGLAVNIIMWYLGIAKTI